MSRHGDNLGNYGFYEAFAGLYNDPADLASLTLTLQNTWYKVPFANIIPGEWIDNGDIANDRIEVADELGIGFYSIQSNISFSSASGNLDLEFAIHTTFPSPVSHLWTQFDYALNENVLKNICGIHQITQNNSKIFLGARCTSVAAAVLDFSRVSLAAHRIGWVNP